MNKSSAIWLYSVVLLLSGCYTSYAAPDYAAEANKALSATETKTTLSADDEANEVAMRLWADKPEYVAAIREEKKIKKAPRLVSSAVPKYPKVPLLAGVKARVVVSFVIGRSGKIDAARVQESSDSRFDQAAIDAVLKWRFLPAETDEGPTLAVGAAPLEFAGKK